MYYTNTRHYDDLRANNKQGNNISSIIVTLAALLAIIINVSMGLSSIKQGAVEIVEARAVAVSFDSRSLHIAEMTR
jgi:hypothetical protein